MEGNAYESLQTKDDWFEKILNEKGKRKKKPSIDDKLSKSTKKLIDRRMEIRCKMHPSTSNQIKLCELRKCIKR